MDKFYSLPKMKKHFNKFQKNKQIATLLGLDIGRIYVGTAISDRYLTKSQPIYTFLLKSGLESQYYPRLTEEFNLNVEFYYGLNKMIIEKKVKGIIIGYPLLNNEPNRHSHFIDSFVRHMIREQIINVPITYVNEAFSTFQAAKFLEMYQVKQGVYDKTITQDKKLKDKVAASIILQKFIDYYNEEENLEDNEN